MAKVTIDKDKCIGCGSCEALCPKSFKVINGKATVKKIEKITCESEAAESCPVGAISVSN